MAGRLRWIVPMAVVPLVLSLPEILSMPPAAAAQNSATACISDSSLSAHICLTIQWNDVFSGSQHYAEVTDVSGAVYQDDPRVAVTDFQIGAVVSGRCYSGCSGTLMEGKLLFNQTTPSYGVVHNERPPWAGDFVNVGGAEYNCGVALAKLQHGGTKWYYTMDYCVGMEPDSLQLQDRERGLDP